MKLWGANNKDIKRICPSCAEEIYPGECEIHAHLPKEELLEETPQGKALLVARHSPKALTGPLYTKRAAYRKCYKCGYSLPYNIELLDNKTIVVVGDVSSGKSHYIAALIHQIEHGLVGHEKQHITFECLTSEEADKFTKDYFQPLFEKNMALPANQQKIEVTSKPLIYHLVIKAGNEHLPQEINLILYDSSGEDYVRLERLLQYSPYVLTADALVFLVDPQAIPEIAARLPKHLRYPVLRTNAATNLNIILSQYRRFHGELALKRQFHIPIAITVSKSDLLDYLKDTEEPYQLAHNPEYGGGVDLADIDAVDAEVRALLDQFGGRALLQATNSLENVKYFATSATSYPPDEHGLYPAVEPRRCLDPVLWLLYQLKVIKNSNYVR